MGDLSGERTLGGRPAGGWTLRAADVLGGYRVIRPLGRGGMGEVYLVENVEMGKRYALKLLPSELAGDREFRERFRREARVMADLEHPGIVRVHYMAEEAGRYFLTMDYVESPEDAPCTLREALARSGRLSEEETRRIALEICAALSVAHARGVVHRDIKPSNVLLDADGRPRLSDFGLARVAGGDFMLSLSQRSISLSAEGAGPSRDGGSVIGTYAWMAPEQKAGLPADERSDVFSVGLVVYAMLTGERAEGRFPLPSELGCSAGWDEVIEKALATRPEGRYADARELVGAVERVRAAPRPAPPRPPVAREARPREAAVTPAAPARPARRPEKRAARVLAPARPAVSAGRPRGGGVAVLVVLLLAAGGGGALYFLLIMSPRRPPKAARAVLAPEPVESARAEAQPEPAPPPEPEPEPERGLGRSLFGPGGLARRRERAPRPSPAPENDSIDLAVPDAPLDHGGRSSAVPGPSAKPVARQGSPSAGTGAAYPEVVEAAALCRAGRWKKGSLVFRDGRELEGEFRAEGDALTFRERPGAGTSKAPLADLEDIAFARPNNIDASMGDFMAKHGRPDEALKRYRKALAGLPGDPAILKRMADIRATKDARGRIDDARASGDHRTVLEETSRYVRLVKPKSLEPALRSALETAWKAQAPGADRNHRALWTRAAERVGVRLALEESAPRPEPKDTETQVYMLTFKAKETAKRDPDAAIGELSQALGKWGGRYDAEIHFAMAMAVERKISRGKRTPALLRRKLAYLKKARECIDAGGRWASDPMGNRSTNLNMSIEQARKELGD